EHTLNSRRRHTRCLSDWSSTCALDRKSTRLNSSHLGISYAVFCLDRKSTRLNSSHLGISYAVFCLKTEENTAELQSLRHLVCRPLLAHKSSATTPSTMSLAFFL